MTRIRYIANLLVAGLGLAALVGIAVLAILWLPNEGKGGNIVTIASSAFSVIGAIVGAYFGVRSANNAIDTVGQTALDQAPGGAG